ncbi:MAG: dihydroorotase [Thiotrichales bacterium]|nr:dihydroorotase [Thiotrichales bacterium]
MTTLELKRPDDFHLHLRDGAEMYSIVRYSAAQFARAIVMPNLDPPVTDVASALAYRDRILAALEGAEFSPLMTLYLTDVTSADEIRAAAVNEHIHAVKYYPAGATTHSENGVTAMENVYPVLEAMADNDLPLLLHGEVTDPAVDVFDREAVFIDTVLLPLRDRFPQLRMVMEHVTTRNAVEFVQSCATNMAATITPQHCLLNRNALFQGGLRPHHYCLPVLKAEAHREAVLSAAVSGDARFFLGTDSAPHARGRKECEHGCAGIFSACAALELYAGIFEQCGVLDRLEGFASRHGARFYKLPENETTITLEKRNWTVPDILPFGDQDEIVPFRAGNTLSWKLKIN